MKWWMVMFLLLASCGGKSVPVVENPYAIRYEKLNAQGQDAWRQGNDASAQTALERALQVAWLSADMKLVADAQYHLGMLLFNRGKLIAAEEMLEHAIEHAKLSDSPLTGLRSRYLLALLLVQQQKPGLKLEALSDDAPADLVLTAARLYQLQGKLDLAEHAYTKVSRMKGFYHQAQGHLGLALVARDRQQADIAVQQSDKVLQLSKKAGFPLLAAHALLLQGKIANDEKKLEQAWQTYKVLGDGQGQRNSLETLLKLAQQAKDEHRMRQWQQALTGLKQGGLR